MNSNYKYVKVSNEFKKLRQAIKDAVALIVI